MLVLERKCGESIVIECPPSIQKQRIEIMVTRFRSGPPRARLGFKASRNVLIQRLEVYEAIQREQGNDGAG